MACLVRRSFRFGVLVGVGVGHVMLCLLRVAGWVVVDLRGPEVVMVVLWSVELAFWVDERVYECAYSVDVEVGDA